MRGCPPTIGTGTGNVVCTDMLYYPFRNGVWVCLLAHGPINGGGLISGYRPMGLYRIFSIISAVLIFFQHPSTPCLYWRPRLYWRLHLYFFNQYIHTEQEEIHARYHACSFDFHQDRANNRDCAYNVSKGAHSVLVLETVLVMETCAYNREYTVCAELRYV